MKNISILLNIVLAVAIAVLYYLHFSCSTSYSIDTNDEIVVENKDEKPAISNGIANVGYINIDSLQDKYELYDVLIQKLKAKQTKYESEISGKMQAFEKKVKDFQQKAPTMSQFEGQTKQQELAEEEQRLYKLREDFTSKFQEEEAKLNDEFQKTVQAYIEKHNEKTNYDIIIGASQLGNIVLDFKSEIDITQQVVDGLNAEYKAKSEKK
ncbi:MAG: OmpH family outer membrane protein [Bacteroidetes bacterium]|nr:OmpH family outer membrane protein [Bacteroidota bacterium]